MLIHKVPHSSNTTIEADDISDYVQSEKKSLENPFIIEKDLKIDKEKANRNKNPFIFFRNSDYPLLISAIISNACSAGTHVANTIMINKLFKKLEKFQMGDYQDVSLFVHDLKWACFSLALIGLGSWLFGSLDSFFFIYLGERQQLRCRRKLFRSLLLRDYSWFESNKGLDGDLVQVNRSVEEYRMALSEYFSMLCNSIFLIVSMSITSFIYCWRLTLLIFASLPLMILTVVLLGKPVQKWSSIEDSFSANTISHIDWNLSSFIWIKIIHSKQLEKFKLKYLLTKCEHAYRKFVIYSGIISGIMFTLALMMFVQSFWFGAWLVRKKYNSTGDVISAFYSCLNVAMTISGLSSLAVIFQKAHTSFEKVMNYLIYSELETNDKSMEFNSFGESLPFDLEGTVKFNEVSFTYNSSSSPVLKNISFELPKNKMSFVIGKSGSGKSTISSLLLKLYNLDQGKIFIDGYDITLLNNFYLRNQITLVQQFPNLFNESVYKNLTLGTSATSVDYDFISKTCSDFNFSNVIDSMPDGFNTLLGKGAESVQLSGGQEQRLNLVRAKLRESPILILDESLSAIDIAQKRELIKKIKEWRQGKTTILITHDFSQIENDDYILLVDNGEIVFNGIKNQLDENNSLFFNVLDETIDINDSTFTPEKDKVSVFEENTNTITNKLEKFDLESQIANDDDEKLENIKDPLIIGFKFLNKFMPLKVKFFYGIGILISIGTSILNPVFSFFISKLIYGIVPINKNGTLDTHQELKWSMISTSIAIIIGILGFISSVTLGFCSERFCKIVRKLSFDRILSQNVKYFENINANEFSTLLINDMRDLRNITSGTFPHLLSGIGITICCIIWTLIIGWKFALVGFSMFPLFGIFSFVGTIAMQNSEFKYKDRLNKLEELTHSTRTGIKTILCLNLQNEFLSTFDVRLRNFLEFTLVRSIAMGIVSNATGFISNLSQAILFFYGLKLVAYGEYSLTDITQIIMMIMMTTGYLSHLMSSAPGIYRGLRVALKLNYLLDLADDPNEINGSLMTSLNELDSGVSFSMQNVTFSYPSAPDIQILKGISFNLEVNKIISFVGESGCGKSTIIALLLRLYSVEGLKLNGVDINTIDLHHLRNNISVVSQKHYFFDGSIRENLLYNHPAMHTISDDAIFETLEKLDLKKFVESLSDGIDSPLCKSRQLLVSGGQAQRFSIARALLRPCSILILDECTASLDDENSSRIMNLLKILKKEKTIICITHNKDLMKNSDVLYFIKNGKLAERGLYDNLMPKKGNFYGMIQYLI